MSRTVFDKAIAIAAVTVMGLAAHGALPAEYQQVVSITSVSGQYVDTGYSVKESTELRFKYAMKCSGYSCPFGTYTDANTKCTRLACDNGSTKNLLVYFRSNANNGWVKFDGVTTGDGQIVEGYMNKDRVRLNAVEKAFAPAQSGAFAGGDDEKTLWLFMRSNATSFTEVTIYSFSILEDGTPVHDYVPCFRKSDLVSGMYDLVKGDFLPMQGRGGTMPELIAGEPASAGAEASEYSIVEGLSAGARRTYAMPTENVLLDRSVAVCMGFKVYKRSSVDVDWQLWRESDSYDRSCVLEMPPDAAVLLEWQWQMLAIPSGYSLLEWLSSDSSQYVDTEYVANVDTVYGFKFTMASTGRGYGGAFGSHPGDGYSCTRFISNNGRAGEYLAYFMSNGEVDGWKLVTLPNGTDYDVLAGYLSKDKIKVNSTEVLMDGVKAGVASDTHSAYIFRVNTGIGVPVKFYYFTISEQGELKHAYFPAKRNEDGAGVMLDLVTGTPLENKGSGDFTCGPQRGSVADDTVYVWKTSVSEGRWNDAANWSAEGPATIGYPSEGCSSAVFPAGTHAQVTMPGGEIGIKSLKMSDQNIKVRIIGGYIGSSVITAPDADAERLQGNEIVFDGTKVESSNYLVVGRDTRIVLTNAASFVITDVTKSVLLGYGLDSQVGKVDATGSLELWNASYLSCGTVAVASRYEVVVSDSTLEVKTGMYFNNRTDGGFVTLLGATPSVIFSGVCCSSSSVSVDTTGGFRFHVPPCGYGMAPVRWENGRYKFGDDPTRGDDGRVCLWVDLSQVRAVSSRIPIVDWFPGVSKEHVTVLPLAMRASRLDVAVEDSSVSVVKMPPKGFVLFVR